MLSKMGWSEGQSLGKDGDGVTEPVSNWFPYFICIEYININMNINNVNKYFKF